MREPGLVCEYFSSSISLRIFFRSVIHDLYHGKSSGSANLGLFLMIDTVEAGMPNSSPMTLHWTHWGKQFLNQQHLIQP